LRCNLVMINYLIQYGEVDAMGLDGHAQNFLTYITKKKSLGVTLTLGRQNDHTNWINPETAMTETYCEPILCQLFGATKVESVDASDYEGATYVQDLNEKWEPSSDLANSKYSSVLDLGTLEHVFNVPQALKSIAASCEIGGRIIHVQTHSDFCGHGFWQFSAELFFSWYSESNGFGNVEIFIAPLGRLDSWFRCLRPDAGQRCELTGSNVPTSYILVVAHKTRDVPNLICQQSDYAAIWDKSNSSMIKSSEASKPIMQTILSPRKILRRLRAKVGFHLPSSFKISLVNQCYSLKKKITPWWANRYLVKENVGLLIARS